MHQLFESLPGAGHRFEHQVLPGIGIELLTVTVIDQRSALEALQIRPLPVDEAMPLTSPDHARRVEKCWQNVVHLLPASVGNEVAGHQVDPAGANLFLGSGPRAYIEDVDFQAKAVGQVGDQIGIGPNQVLRVEGVMPKVRWVFRISGSGQAFTRLGSHCQRWQQPEAQQANQTLDHARTPADDAVIPRSLRWALDVKPASGGQLYPRALTGPLEHLAHLVGFGLGNRLAAQQFVDHTQALLDGSG